MRLVPLKLFIPFLLLPLLLLPGSALAIPLKPAWSVRSTAFPTEFMPVDLYECGGERCGDGYFVTVTNVGTAASSGDVVVTDTIPAGASIARVERSFADSPSPGIASEGQGERVHCSTSSARVATCEDTQPLPPGGIIAIHIFVDPPAQLGTELGGNYVSVKEEGGIEAAPVTVAGTPTGVTGARAGFGAQISVGALGRDGESDTQAGTHPTTILTSIAYNGFLHEEPGIDFEPFLPVAEPRVENVDLPLGFVGDAGVTPKCTEAELSSEACPGDSRIGVVGLFQANGIHDNMINLYNIVPESGYPAQFGFDFIKAVVMLRPRVLPSATGYVLSVGVPAIPTSEPIKPREVSTEFFGDPALVNGATGGGDGEAFATTPDNCAGGQLSAKLEMNAWVEPNNWQYVEAPVFAASSSQGVTGCQALQFSPELEVKPVGVEGKMRDKTTGYEVEVTTPRAQEGLTTPEDLAPADIKDAVVTLPEGVTVSPGAANGLVACQASGPEGIELGNHDLVSDANQVQEGEEMGVDGLVHAAPGHCPQASQVGEVEIETPLLEAPLKGHVFIAAPGCGGSGQPACTPTSAEDGELFGLYVEVAGSGAIVKLHGNVSVNPSTGQLTTTFKEAPQLPFSKLRMRLKGGQGAALANPQSCGTYTVTSDMTPWSTPYTPNATPSSRPFAIEGCSNAFAPSFSAGMSGSLYAGSFSPFALTVVRQDGEQDLSGITTVLPPGLLGKIAGVVQCGQAEVAAAEANTGTCPEGSRLGVATAAAGAGSEPFWQSGNVYLTGPYDGAPFGLAVVVPADAGPYHLGNIVVRARIEINSSTAQVVVISDPLPEIIDGVPLRLKTVNVAINREDFMFNATNCVHRSIMGTITGAQGSQVAVSTAYGPSGCAGLPFKPTFSASTSAKTSKADGASLVVRGGLGEGDARVARIAVSLPGALPSRLTTIQKACLAATFEANPAACPEGSNIGVAIVHTPLLVIPVSGPIFLVSHGGAAWPDIEMVLQGEGVKVILDAQVVIRKGITSATFDAIPDVPFSSFETVFPEGPHSAVTTVSPTTSLCSLTKTVRAKTKITVRGKNGHTRRVTRTVTRTVAESLVMPTTITAQNGAVFTQSTKIAVTGCPVVQGAAKNKKVKHRAAKASRGGK
jgi:hypothetical protein